MRLLLILLVVAVACDADDKACLVHSHCSSSERCLEGICASPPEPVDAGKAEAGPAEAGPVDSGSDAGLDGGGATDAAATDTAATDTAADVGSLDAAPINLDASPVDGSSIDSSSADGAVTDLFAPLADVGLISDASAGDTGGLADALSPSAEAGP